jgi:hypothetical protein
VKIKVILQLVIDLIFRSPLKEGSVMKNCRVFCGRVSQNSRDYKIVDRCNYIELLRLPSLSMQGRQYSTVYPDVDKIGQNLFDRSGGPEFKL